MDRSGRSGRIQWGDSGWCTQHLELSWGEKQIFPVMGMRGVSAKGWGESGKGELRCGMDGVTILKKKKGLNSKTSAKWESTFGLS